MQIFALFHSSSTLNLAISQLESTGIEQKNIFVVPIKRENVNIPRDESFIKREAIDKGFAFATGISVITAGIGFRLTWGPIIWGILGAGAGFFVGLFINFLQKKIRGQSTFKDTLLPTILVVNCDDTMIKKTEKVLYEKGAMGVNTPLWDGS